MNHKTAAIDEVIIKVVRKAKRVSGQEIVAAAKLLGHKSFTTASAISRLADEGYLARVTLPGCKWEYEIGEKTWGAT